MLAFIFGAIANRLRMPPLVGYLVAGVLVGPYTPGFVANGEIASELSEIGVILLMFGVGLNFSLNDLLHVQAVAVPGALLRIAGGTALGMGLAALHGLVLGRGLIFGLALSVASTVVLLKTLQDRHLARFRPRPHRHRLGNRRGHGDGARPRPHPRLRDSARRDRARSSMTRSSR